MSALEFIRPDWTVAPGIRALTTIREGGVSRGPWATFNLGRHCGDDVEAVAENHRRLADALPAAPRWLKQVHGTRLIHLDDWHPNIEADAAWTDHVGQVAVVQTADCLPVLLAHRRARLVAAVHAGWRGLAAGVIEQVVEQLPVTADELIAWIGPAISQPHYEVSDEVRSAFVDSDPDLAAAFEGNARQAWQADLKAIARHQLAAAGIRQVLDSGLCTAAEPTHFFSYRRDQGRTGRHASLIWIEPD